MYIKQKKNQQVDKSQMPKKNSELEMHSCLVLLLPLS